MRIRKLFINSTAEVVVKVVKEVLSLFKIEVNENIEEPDFDIMSIFNERQNETGAAVLKTTLTFIDGEYRQVKYELINVAHVDEKEAASIHRLIKLNLYQLLRDNYGMPPAPWGILHGVRPTKIVHRFLNAGLNSQQIIERLKTDYEVSEEKAIMITQLAFKQLPFLAQSRKNVISIYVGIPYCLSRCLYCSFPAYVLPSEKELDVFMDAFKKDLEAAKEAVDKYGFKVQNIYVGGGTPTSLPDEYFREMLKLVYDAFYMDDTIEFTVEAGRPDTMTPAKIDAMAKMKVNRVSVNPQTMQKATLKRIGRHHTPEDIIKMYNDLEKVGLFKINMDLIIGLPGETEADVEDTMKQLSVLNPHDITLHSLALKRGSILKMQLEDYELPNDETARRMFKVAMEYILSWGLEPYYLYRQGYQSGHLENVGCARNGAESMYNIQIMEERQTIIGIGGSATTKVVFPKTGRLKAVFTPKELSIYLRETDVYIDKRAKLLAEAYEMQGENVSC